MAQISHLKARANKVIDQMEAMLELVAEEEREFNETEQEEYNSLEKRSEEFKGLISKLEKAAEARKSFVTQETKPENVQVIREHNHNESGEYRGFSSLGEQLRAVRTAENPGRFGSVDPRLSECQRAILGANEQQGSEGAFAVQTDFVAGIMDKARQQSSLASLCDPINVSSASNSATITLVDETSRADGSRFGGALGYWRAEGDSVAASKPALRQENVKLESLDVLYYATEEVVEDSALLSSLAGRAFASELAYKLDDAILNGDGSRKPLGILSSASLISVAKEGSQTADTIEFANVRKMKNRMYAPSRNNAVWLVHADVPGQLEQMVLAGASSDVPVYMPAGGISGREFDTLYGNRVIVTEQCQALGDLGDIIFADLSQYLLLRKGGIRAAESAHVQFITSQMTFKWSMRVNGLPMWNSALTDANGSTTRSPFIALAERA